MKAPLKPEILDIARRLVAARQPTGHLTSRLLEHIATLEALLDEVAECGCHWEGWPWRDLHKFRAGVVSFAVATDGTVVPLTGEEYEALLAVRGSLAAEWVDEMAVDWRD